MKNERMKNKRLFIRMKFFILNTNQELNVVMFYRSYHFVQELKANSPASESGARGIGF